MASPCSVRDADISTIVRGLEAKSGILCRDRLETSNLLVTNAVCHPLKTAGQPYTAGGGSASERTTTAATHTLDSDDFRAGVIRTTGSTTTVRIPTPTVQFTSDSASNAVKVGDMKVYRIINDTAGTVTLSNTGATGSTIAGSATVSAGTTAVFNVTVTAVDSSAGTKTTQWRRLVPDAALGLNVFEFTGYHPAFSHNNATAQAHVFGVGLDMGGGYYRNDSRYTFTAATTAAGSFLNLSLCTAAATESTINASALYTIVAHATVVSTGVDVPCGVSSAPSSGRFNLSFPSLTATVDYTVSVTATFKQAVA